MQKITTRALSTRNVGQTTSVENANGVGRPGSREVETRTHLREELLLVRSLQEGLLSKSSHIVALAQKPGEDLHCYKESGGFYSELLLGELGGDLDVVAELSINLLDLLRNVLSGLSQETVRSSLGKSRSAKVVNNNFSTGSNHVHTHLLHDCSKGTGIEPKRKQFYQGWWNERSPRDWENNRDKKIVNNIHFLVIHPLQCNVSMLPVFIIGSASTAGDRILAGFIWIMVLRHSAERIGYLMDATNPHAD